MKDFELPVLEEGGVNWRNVETTRKTRWNKLMLKWTKTYGTKEDLARILNGDSGPPPQDENATPETTDDSDMELTNINTTVTNKSDMDISTRSRSGRSDISAGTRSRSIRSDVSAGRKSHPIRSEVSPGTKSHSDIVDTVPLSERLRTKTAPRKKKRVVQVEEQVTEPPEPIDDDVTFLYEEKPTKKIKYIMTQRGIKARMYFIEPYY